MDPREEHQAAVAAAIQTVSEFQTLLQVAGEKADEAVGMIIQASGETATVDSGRMALEQTASVRDRLPELVATLEASKENLLAYAAGF